MDIDIGTDIETKARTQEVIARQRPPQETNQIGESVVLLTGVGSPGPVTQLSTDEIQMMITLLDELCAALPGENNENLRCRTRAIINVFWDIQDN